ncbi:MAG: O-antigen ligase family protein [Kiritimatiellae bacterium]|nr:O-antigen ligase family protein [Kiritimatiellia bacterium]
MWFLYDNIVAIQIAVICSAFAWLYGGTVAAALTPTIPWLLALLFEFMLCFPQRHSGETTYEARERMWSAIKRDPLTWIALALMALLLIPLANKALCPVCDYPLIAFDGKSAAPPVPYLPSCVNRMHHLNVVLWFIPALTAMMAVKHSLLKRGKRMVVELMVWNGFALSLLGIVQAAASAPGPLWTDLHKVYYFSTFGYPNMAGDYFTTLFALAVATWRWKVEEARNLRNAKDKESVTKANHKIFWSKHIMLVPAVFFFVSALMTLSRATILLAGGLAILFYAHALTTFLARMHRAKRVKAACANLFAFVLIATLVFVFLSDPVQNKVLKGSSFPGHLKKEWNSFDMKDAIDRTSGQGQYHARLAVRVWKDHPIFGVGGWGYKHLSIPKMTDEEYKNIQRTGGANVHNDFLQFLAEHGIAGVALILVIIAMLVWPLGRVWKALIDSVRFTKPKDQPPKPIAIFALPAPVFCILLSAVATLLHSLGDCPLRSPAVLSLFFVSLASMDGFMPKIKEK